jgi:hypothetical protein
LIFQVVQTNKYSVPHIIDRAIRYDNNDTNVLDPAQAAAEEHQQAEEVAKRLAAQVAVLPQSREATDPTHGLPPAMSAGIRLTNDPDLFRIRVKVDHLHYSPLPLLR